MEPQSNDKDATSSLTTRLGLLTLAAGSLVFPFVVKKSEHLTTWQSALLIAACVASLLAAARAFGLLKAPMALLWLSVAIAIACSTTTVLLPSKPVEATAPAKPAPWIDDRVQAELTVSPIAAPPSWLVRGEAWVAANFALAPADARWIAVRLGDPQRPCVELNLESEDAFPNRLKFHQGIPIPPELAGATPHGRYLVAMRVETSWSESVLAYECVDVTHALDMTRPVKELIVSEAWAMLPSGALFVDTRPMQPPNRFAGMAVRQRFRPARMTSIRLGARIGDVGDRVEHQGLEVSLGDGVSVVLGDKDRRSAAVKVRREVVCEIVTQDRDLFAHGESVDWTIVFTHESDTGACAKDRVTIRCGDYELPTCVLQHTTLPDEWTLYLRAWGARVELSRLEVAFDEDRTASADEVERLFLGR